MRQTNLSVDNVFLRHIDDAVALTLYKRNESLRLRAQIEGLTRALRTVRLRLVRDNTSEDEGLYSEADIVDHDLEPRAISPFALTLMARALAQGRWADELDPSLLASCVDRDVESGAALANQGGYRDV